MELILPRRRVIDVWMVFVFFDWPLHLYSPFFAQAEIFSTPMDGGYFCWPCRRRFGEFGSDAICFRRHSDSFFRPHFNWVHCGNRCSYFGSNFTLSKRIPSIFCHVIDRHFYRNRYCTLAFALLVFAVSRISFFSPFFDPDFFCNWFSHCIWLHIASSLVLLRVEIKPIAMGQDSRYLYK